MFLRVGVFLHVPGVGLAHLLPNLYGTGLLVPELGAAHRADSQVRICQVLWKNRPEMQSIFQFGMIYFGNLSDFVNSFRKLLFFNT